jgi:YVTN family beta-propeller protein
MRRKLRALTVVACVSLFILLFVFLLLGYGAAEAAPGGAGANATVPSLATKVGLSGATSDRAATAEKQQSVTGASELAPVPVVVATIPLSLSPPLSRAAVVVNPVNGYAYVLARRLSPIANLVIISGADLISSSTSSAYGGALAVNSGLGRVYMPVMGGLATISGTEIISVTPIGQAYATVTGQAIDVDPDSGYVYTAGYDWSAICIPEAPQCGGILWSVVDGSVTRLGVGGIVHAIGVHPATGYAYAAIRTGGLFDIKQTAVIHQAQMITRVQAFGEAMAIHAEQGYVYLAEAQQNRVRVLSGTEVVTTLATGTQPRAIGVNPRTGFVYVANAGSQNVTVISDTQVITTLKVGQGPAAIGVNPESGYVYVTNAAADSVSVISGTQSIWAFHVDGAPSAIGVNPDTGYAYIVNYEDATILIMREMNLSHHVYLPVTARQ